MNFENKLISGQFIKRYKRFFVEVMINGKIITAHCPNTGSMQGLLKEGNDLKLKVRPPNMNYLINFSESIASI